MSCARDNSLKQWVFDGVDGSARLLRFRSGHAAPPTVVRHYGSGRLLLSAGQDRAFRAFSTIQDQQSRELSQHHTQRRAKRLKIEERELKLAPVLALDACDVSAGHTVVATVAAVAADVVVLRRLGRLMLDRDRPCCAACTSPKTSPFLTTVWPHRLPQVRERDWSNVITAHEDDTRAYVWRLQKYTLGEWVSARGAPLPCPADALSPVACTVHGH